MPKFELIPWNQVPIFKHRLSQTNNIKEILRDLIFDLYAYFPNGMPTEVLQEDIERAERILKQE